MQLYSPLLSINSKDFVKTAVVDFDCNFNKTAVIKKMHEDGFGELNWARVLSRYRPQFFINGTKFISLFFANNHRLKQICIIYYE